MWLDFVRTTQHSVGRFLRPMTRGVKPVTKNECSNFLHERTPFALTLCDCQQNNCRSSDDNKRQHGKCPINSRAYGT